MPRIEAIRTALPPNLITQAQARAACERVFAGDPRLLRLLRVFDRSGVETRHFAFPPKYYLSEKTFEERNKDYIAQATSLAENAARDCLDSAGVRADEVDHLFLVTTTGLATPSLDALLVPRLGLGPQTRRWPLFGLGCAGGVGGLIRADQVLRSHPGQRALVVSVELCGQVFSPRATQPVDVVGAALFGDGAAAALVAGDAVAKAGPRVIASRTVLFEDSKHIMGWTFTSEGLRLVLSEEVTGLVKQRLRPVIEDFLRSSGLALEDISHCALHPGGRRIIDAYAEAFGFSGEMLQWTRGSLARVGNLSSASVLFILGDILRDGRAGEGDVGLVAALGPGFGTEMMALRW